MRAGILLLALAAQAQSPVEIAIGPEGMVNRYLTRLAREQWQARAARIAQIRTPAEAEERQRYVRAKLIEQVGGLPAEKTPLHARVTGTLDRGDYRVEKLIFESLPRFYVTASVFVPKTGKPPYPAVLGTSGHTLSAKAADYYQRGWIALAKRGFLVLAYDPPGQGERGQYFDPATGKSKLGGTTDEHTMSGAQCLLTGTNIARYFIWDGMRALDYLLTRSDVDPRRIAVAGNSGGGTQAAYLAAFEPRLAAAAPACYITSWETLWSGPGPQDAEQDFANFLADGLDFPDFLISAAPRPVLVAAATRDYFPIAGARATYAEARRIYEVLGAGERMGFFEYDDTHGWSKPRREATYRWFARWLQNREDGSPEGDFEVDTPEALQSTETGQVATSFPRAETVRSLNAALAERLHAERRGAGGKEVPALVRERFRIPETRGVPAWEKRGETGRDGYRIEEIEMQPEPGITVPALAFVPESGPARRPAVLWVNPAGGAADAGEGGALERLARAGILALAVDPRGWGGSAPPARTTGGYSKAFQLAMRALLVGRTMPGMQTGDVLRAFDYLRSRHDADGTRIAAIGKGHGGVVALLATALEPRIAKVACQNAPTSYMEIVRAETYPNLMEIVAPGVLRDFDLPDVAASVRPRTVWQVNEERPDFAAWLHW